MKLHITQKGLSIVELMIALALGLVLIAGLLQIFSSNQRSFVMAEANMRVQETGRMITEFLGRAIRNADYWGCVDRGSVANKLDETHADYVAAEDLYSFSDGFMAYQSDGTILGLDKTDALIIRGVDGAGEVYIESVMPNSSANLKVNTVNGISKSDILMVSDCIAGDIFQVTGLQSGANPGIGHATGGNVAPGNAKGRGGVDVVIDNSCPGNAANCLSKQYDESAQILRPYYRRFFMMEDADGRRALFRKDGTNAAQEIMDGIWDMQFQVGIDSGLSNGEVTQWVDVDSPTALSTSAASEVVAVRMSILTRSPENNIVDAPMELCYPGWTDCSAGNNFKVKDKVASDSRHLYRVFNSTSTIRNRIALVEQN